MKNLPIENIAAQKGMKIFTGVGPHTINAYTIVCRVQDTVIASATNPADAAITMTNHMPTGTKLNLAEMFVFSEKVKTITLTNATDSIAVVL